MNRTPRLIALCLLPSATGVLAGQAPPAPATIEANAGRPARPPAPVEATVQPDANRLPTPTLIVPHPVPTIPVGSYVVINNTRRSLSCAWRSPAGAWVGWYSIGPGANWRRDNPGRALHFQCQRPVAQVQYTLVGGRRYSLLRAGRSVQLVEVTASAGR
jgi:hypothetical protein